MTEHRPDTGQQPDSTGGVAGLLLAAGGGRRLGGRPKALLSHHGRPLVEHALRSLREGGCDPLYVVLGAAANDVRARAALPDCVLLDNPDWADGMGSSLRTGLAALAGSGADAAVVSLVDQPGIGPDAVARVRAAAGVPAAATTAGNAADDTAAGALADSLVAAAYSGRRGHPVLFGSAHWRGIAESATGDQGARAYLQAHAAALTLVECGDIADPSDIDTPADLGRLAP